MAHELGIRESYSPLGVVVLGQPGGHTISSALLGVMPATVRRLRSTLTVRPFNPRTVNCGMSTRYARPFSLYDFAGQCGAWSTRLQQRGGAERAADHDYGCSNAEPSPRGHRSRPSSRGRSNERSTVRVWSKSSGGRS